jgi:hypothetical protein
VTEEHLQSLRTDSEGVREKKTGFFRKLQNNELHEIILLTNITELIKPTKF